MSTDSDGWIHAANDLNIFQANEFKRLIIKSVISYQLEKKIK
jgi:hypothetical protein